MKTHAWKLGLIGLTLAILGTNIFSVAHAEEAKLDGTWEVVARVCEPSGNPGRDRFVLGRDRSLLKINGSAIRVVTTIEGETWVRNGRLTLDGRNIVATTLEKGKKTPTVEVVGIEMTPHPTLILTSSCFGPGGTCAPGETHKSYFRRSTK